MTTTFWSNDLSILLNKNYITELWPTSNMTYEEKLNAITRLVILLSILGYIFTMSKNIVLIGFLMVAVIFLLYRMQKRKLTKEILNSKEGFSGINNSNSNSEGTILTPDTLQNYLKSDFTNVNKKNPLGNVLLTEIVDNPNRKPAPPSFNTEVYEDINVNTKKMVQSLNPGIKNTNKQLYGDLGEQFEFDQSQRSFYSTPNTKIPNDQGAFANYLYGDMPSCRDGDAFACIQDNFRYNLY
jgi:hypothetical protein|uniref:Minor capsid protein P9 transmembrane helices domain-containing protein n=1 Tax=viral metagenome TaxID=1070528 RepID=A0A6C0D801_9ZZZZ